MGGVYRIQTFFGFLYFFYIYKAPNIKKKKKKFFFFFLGISRIPFQVGNSANSATFPRSRKITGPNTYIVIVTPNGTRQIVVHS